MTTITDNSPPKRVLIIKPSALGDVITALPVLRGLRRSFGGDVRIDWLINPSCAPLVADDPDLSNVVVFDRKRYGTMWRNPVAGLAFSSFCKKLRKNNYDWVIDLQGLFRSGFLAGVTRAAVRAGFASAREFAGIFYNIQLPAHGEPDHTVDRNIALVKHLGIDARPEDLTLHIAGPAKQWAAETAGKIAGDFVIVSPATRWATKLYPQSHWQRVVAQLSKKATVVITAGPGEEHLAAPLAGTAGVVNLAGKTTVTQLAALVARSAGLISCDSAIMNMATALGVPQVTLIGPTDPARTGPYGRDDAVVRAMLPCGGCLKRTCSHIACMESITPAEVVAVAGKRIACLG